MRISSLDSGFSDIVVVKGGIAGATMALVLSRAGLTVTVLEQQLSYGDRVRGEYMQPWGVAEAQHLGISEILIEAGAFLPAASFRTTKSTPRMRQRRRHARR